MFKAIVSILGPALSIWQHKNAVKYMVEMQELEVKYDNESDKERPDHNVLDRLDRDLLRIKDLVAFEITASKTNSL